MFCLCQPNDVLMFFALFFVVCVSLECLCVKSTENIHNNLQDTLHVLFTVPIKRFPASVILLAHVNAYFMIGEVEEKGWEGLHCSAS